MYCNVECELFSFVYTYVHTVQLISNLMLASAQKTTVRHGHSDIVKLASSVLNLASCFGLHLKSRLLTSGSRYEQTREHSTSRDYLCYAQTGNLCNPWIVLRKVSIDTLRKISMDCTILTQTRNAIAMAFVYLVRLHVCIADEIAICMHALSAFSSKNIHV